jgi:hypothetical protein
MLTYRIITVSSLILALNACGAAEEETSTTTNSTATSETGTNSTTTTETGLMETGLTETGTTTTPTNTTTSTTPTTTTTTTTPPLTLADGVQDILNADCTSYCHSGGGASANLDLSSGNSHAGMVGVSSVQSTLDIVTAGDASSSYLVYKLANTHSEPPANGSGSSMPKGGDALSAADQALIVAWINDGANP